MKHIEDINQLHVLELRYEIMYDNVHIPKSVACLRHSSLNIASKAIATSDTKLWYKFKVNWALFLWPHMQKYSFLDIETGRYNIPWTQF
jgi:hypothetical protein